MHVSSALEGEVKLRLFTTRLRGANVLAATDWVWKVQHHLQILLDVHYPVHRLYRYQL